MNLRLYLEKVRKYGLIYGVDIILEKLTKTENERSQFQIQRWYGRLPEKCREEELESWFQAETGKTLNLHSPQTFNEKIQWMKLYFCRS